jgi:hypothetical protein
MKFKKIYFAFLFILVTNSSFGQLTKFKSSSYTSKFKNENTGNWSKWSELEKTEVLITIDITNERIKIFSKKEQVYDIIKYYDKQTDSDGDETMQFQCVNEDGLKCYVRFVILNSQNGRRQLYIDFADLMWVYNIYKLD